MEEPCLIEKSELNRLIERLIREGFLVLGPRVEDSAILYCEIQSMRDLPRGYRDTQEPGKYRVAESSGENYFEFNLGPHSWKQFLFPPKQKVTSCKKTDNGWEFTTNVDSPPKFAFLGVRACELAAIEVQDRVFLEGPFVDPVYQARRESTFIIAVNCTVAASTCFCTSMGTGPKCKSAFDLALTELDDGFVVEVGTTRGRSMISDLNIRKIDREHASDSQLLQQRACDQITKRMDTSGIRNLLLENLDHPHWDDVAKRCLSCTNCTMVCPTCFCSSVTEVSNLSGDQIERERQWDSCFNVDFSYTASGTVRDDVRSRYRQWLTHKLASWHDQFDSSGCVGCGRCITWCPVGIDLTAEVAAIRNTPFSNRTLPVIQPVSKAACAFPKDVKP